MEPCNDVIFPHINTEQSVQPGITPRREIDTLVHIARHVQGHALPDQSVTLNTLSSPFEMNGGIAPTSPSIW